MTKTEVKDAQAVPPKESLLDVKRVIKPWNCFKVTEFLLNLCIPFNVEKYEKYSATILIPKIHPHHLDGVDYRNSQ